MQLIVLGNHFLSTFKLYFNLNQNQENKQKILAMTSNNKIYE